MTWQLCERDSVEALPRVLPSTWLQTDPGVFQHINGLMVISSVVQDCAQDGRRWHHVSCSRVDRLPSYQDLQNVKRLFVGAERKAVQVFPRESEWCNDHPYCLHLWSCLDNDGIPDFRIEGRI